MAWILYLSSAVVASSVGRLPRWVLVWILAAAIAMRVVCLVRTPPLSTDVWRYLWDGRVINAGVNPYRYPPEAADETKPYPATPQVNVLRSLKNESWEPINFKHVPTIYPPLAQMLFAFLAWTRERDAEAFRWTFAAFDVASILILVPLLRRTGRPAERVIWYAWCPLAATEVTAGAHVDAFALFLLLLALLLAARAGGRPGAASGIVLGAAVMAKGYALLAVPFFVRRGGWRVLLAVAATLIVLAAPFLGARGHLFDGLGTYLRGWTTNASVFLIVDHVLKGITSEHLLAARHITLTAVLAVVAILAWRQKPGTGWLLGATFGAIGAHLLLGAPTLPWYVLWLVPALCWCDIPGLALLTFTVSAQYYARWLYPAGDEASRYALLWRGYVPVYVLLIGQFALWQVSLRCSRTSRNP